jgi:hypothetical protein
MKPKFKASVKDGKLIHYSLDRLKQWYKKYEGQDVAITIEKWSSIRTIQQNAYLHGVVFKLIADETGMTLKEAKDSTKLKLGFYENPNITIDGNDIYILKETSKLSKKEFGEFVDMAREFAQQDLNIFIPAPDEVDLDSLYYYDN